MNRSSKLGWDRGTSTPTLPAPEQPKARRMPADQGLRRDIHQRLSPRKLSGQEHQESPRRIVESSWGDLALLVVRQLFPEEKNFSRQRCARLGTKDCELSGVRYEQSDERSEFEYAPSEATNKFDPRRLL